MPALGIELWPTKLTKLLAAPPKKSGGLMGTLMNGLGIFVLTLVAVVLGGFINAKLHPLPDLQLDKDGKIKAIVPVVGCRQGRREGRRPSRRCITPSILRWWSISKTARRCASCKSPCEVMAHDEKAIDSVQKNIPVIRNNLLLLMSNRNYQSMMSREGKEKLRAGSARRGARRAEERRRPGRG